MHGFLAEDHGRRVVEEEGREPPDRIAPALQCRLADETGLVAADGEADSRLVRIVLVGHVDAPGPVTLLQPQGVEGGAPGRDRSEVPAGLPERVPEPEAEVGGGVQLPAQLADVAQAQGRDRDVADVGLPGAEVAERLVREVVRRERLDEVAGERAPDADAAGAGGDVPDVDAGGRVPEQVVEVGGGVGADLEAVGGEAGDGEVGADASGLVQEEGVGDRPGLPAQVVGGHAVEEVECSGAGDLQAAQRGHVVERDPLAGGQRLGRGDGGPVPGRPGVAGGQPQVLGEPGVGLVPVGAFPASALQEVRAQFPLPGVEGADPQRPRPVDRLERVDDVVHLDELLCTALTDVRR